MTRNYTHEPHHPLKLFPTGLRKSSSDGQIDSSTVCNGIMMQKKKKKRVLAQLMVDLK